MTARKQTPETAILSACAKYLNLRKVFWLRINIQGVFDQRLGKYRPSPYVLPGTADLLVIKDGHPIFIELKAPRGRLSADQVLFKELCDAYGIEYEVVRSVDELQGLGI